MKEEYDFGRAKKNPYVHRQQAQKGSCVMTKTFVIDAEQKPTKEQLQEVMNAKKQPIVFDEDSPELSPAMCKAFKSAVVLRNRRKSE